MRTRELKRVSEYRKARMDEEAKRNGYLITDHELYRRRELYHLVLTFGIVFIGFIVFYYMGFSAGLLW